MSSERVAAADAESFALARGIRNTRGAIDRWRDSPGDVLGPWFAGAFAVGVGLIAAVLGVSLLVPADLTPVYLVGISDPVSLDEAGPILLRNLLVLALHATACVAGFIAGSSLKDVAAAKTGLSRVIHDRAGPVAIAWVVAVTGFSLVTQAYALGLEAAQIAGQLDISTAALISTVLPHALIELTAVFLPLAAWLIASRRDEWQDLLAATFVTTSLALPMLLVAAALELTLWPRLLELASPVV